MILLVVGRSQDLMQFIWMDLIKNITDNVHVWRLKSLKFQNIDTKLNFTLDLDFTSKYI